MFNTVSDNALLWSFFGAFSVVFTLLFWYAYRQAMRERRERLGMRNPLSPEEWLECYKDRFSGMSPEFVWEQLREIADEIDVEMAYLRPYDRFDAQLAVQGPWSDWGETNFCDFFFEGFQISPENVEEFIRVRWLREATNLSQKSSISGRSEATQ